MIHFRYFDNNFDRNYLWEDLAEACAAQLASAEAVDHLPAFLHALETGAFSGPVVWVLHFHEPDPLGTGYYRLSAEAVSRWQTPTIVYYVTGGEVSRVQHHLQTAQLPDCVRAHPDSLSFLYQWSADQLAAWQACFTLSQTQALQEQKP